MLGVIIYQSLVKICCSGLTPQKEDSRVRGLWEASSLGKSQGRMLGEGAAKDETLRGSEGWR